MSHPPIDPVSDPLLAELAQLGVPAGGAPLSTGAGLLAKAAAAAPVIVGLTGLKLYSLLGATLLLGFGGGAVVTTVVQDEPAPVVITVPTPAPAPTALPTPERELTPTLTPALTPALTPVRTSPAPPRASATITPGPSAPLPDRTAPPRLASSGCPEVPAEDDWVPEPLPRTDEPGSSPPPPVAAAEVASEHEPIAQAEASRIRTSTTDRQRAEGHLRAGLAGGVFFLTGTAAPDLSVAVGLELLGPGTVRAAPLLAINADAGLASRDGRALGTAGLDGEMGLALRPSRKARIELGGSGGVRLLQQTTEFDEREEREDLDRRPGVPGAYPTFGGRLSLILGDRERSPLAFRASLVGQGLVQVNGTRGATIFPMLGGTIGLDIALPEPGDER